jgi:hypothetical protein
VPWALVLPLCALALPKSREGTKPRKPTRAQGKDLIDITHQNDPS